MSQELLLGTLLALAALAIACVAGWVGAALVGLAADRVRRWPAPHQARIFAHARLLPLSLASILVPAQIVAFVRFEAGGSESAGLLLLSMAGAGLMLLVASVRAGRHAWRSTRDVSRDWRRSAIAFTIQGWAHRAWLIRRRYPIVAIIGIVRPQLFMARQVAEACTPDELAAIAAHERAHVRAGDNLLRWLFAVTPGAGVMAPFARRLEHAWATAAEEAADAAARDRTSALDLASALTKVARLTSGLEPEAAAGSALVAGSDLKTRVARLLAPPATRQRIRVGWLPAILALVAAAVLWSPGVSLLLHEAFETLVSK